MDSIKLSQNQKEQMLQSIFQEEAIRQKRKRKYLSAVACVVLVLGIGSGVGYAATGHTPLRFLTSFFQIKENSETDLAAGFVSADEKFSNQNIQYEVQQYFYDASGQILYVQVHLQSTDDQPFLNWETAYQYGCNEYGLNNSFENVKEWKEECLLKQEEMEQYQEIVEQNMQGQFFVSVDGKIFSDTIGESSLELVNDREGYLYLDFEEIKNPDKPVTLVYCDSDDKTVWKSKTWKDSGKIRSYTIDDLDKSKNIKLSVSGYGISGTINQAVFEDADTWPFQKIEVILSDGTVYYFRADEKREKESGKKYPLSFYRRTDIVKNKTFVRFYYQNGFKRVYIDVDSIKSVKIK